MPTTKSVAFTSPVTSTSLSTTNLSPGLIVVVTSSTTPLSFTLADTAACKFVLVKFITSTRELLPLYTVLVLKFFTPLLMSTPKSLLPTTFKVTVWSVVVGFVTLTK